MHSNLFCPRHARDVFFDRDHTLLSFMSFSFQLSPCLLQSIAQEEVRITSAAMRERGNAAFMLEGPNPLPDFGPCSTCMLDQKSAILCTNPLTTVAADSCDSLKSRLQVGRSVHESPYHGGSRLVRLVKFNKKKGEPFFSLDLTSRMSRLPPW